MALFDRIKQQREKLKGLSPKEKAGYFVEYYKWHVIIIVALAIWVGITIYQAVTTPDVYLCGARSPTLQADSLPAEPPWKPKNPGMGSLSLL